jgi:hypothetical protein
MPRLAKMLGPTVCGMLARRVAELRLVAGGTFAVTHACLA